MADILVNPDSGTAALSAGALALSRRLLPRSWEHHLSLDHHRGELSVSPVYRDLQDNRAPPDMDRYSNASKPFRPARAKDIGLRLDRCSPKPRWDVETGQGAAEIVSERRQRTAMHVAAVVEMTVIDIEFADELVLIGIGNADTEVSRHTGTRR